MIFEEVIIVGCGPCGMATALELKKYRINPLIIEKGNIVNTIHSFPTHQTFFSSSYKLEIGNMPFISSKHKPVRNEALAYYREVAKRNELRINAFETVVKAFQKENMFVVKTTNQFGKEILYKTKYLILATGYHDQPNLLNVPGSKLPHVNHYFKEAHPYFNQKVAVIGGKNSAIDTALELYHANADVTLIYRGPDYSKSIKPWILPEFVSLVKHNKIKMVFNAEVVQIDKDTIHYQVSNEIMKEPIDFVFAMTGYHPQIEFLKKLDIQVDSKSGRPHFNQETYETNINNLYIAGVIISGFDGNETFIENGRYHGYKIAKSIYLDKELEGKKLSTKKIIRIAIDGPAAAGKSTVAKLIAEELNYVYIDTGAMYRALTLKILDENIELDNEKLITELLTETTIELKASPKGQLVFLDDTDVTKEIRTAKVSQSVSHIAQLAKVRANLVRRQKLLAKNHSIVMDGRDIGTTVLPDAEVKVFLIASVNERAERRHEENLKKGFTSNLDSLKKEIRERDHRDETREESPLIRAQDAVSIDTTSLSIEEVVDKIIKLVTNYKKRVDK